LMLLGHADWHDGLRLVAAMASRKRKADS